MLSSSVMRNPAEALLLSGGLDSSILACILRPKCCITAAYGTAAPDLPFAAQVAKKYCKSHVEVVLDDARMLELVEQVVQILKTFDPTEIRNSSVALAGMQQAKNDGYSSVMTGDGGDELFAGYNYLSRYFSDPEKLDLELRRLWEVMHFSSMKLGEHMGIDVRSPFLDDEFATFAKSLAIDKKAGERAGLKWGKFVLRECYEPELGAMIAWRPKLAQEQGAATDNFHYYLDRLIDDPAFASRAKRAQEEGVKLKSKEHLHYYTLFRSHNSPPKDQVCELRCPDCMACMEYAGRYCRTCGAFPVTPVRLL
ncbi:MAG: asparagine synthase C-terminal domain-containing protein [Nitrososphaera sp.]